MHMTWYCRGAQREDSHGPRFTARYLLVGVGIFALLAVAMGLTTADARRAQAPSGNDQDADDSKPILSLAMRSQLTPREIPQAALEVAAAAENAGDFDRALRAFEQARWDAQLVRSIPAVTTSLREQGYFLTRRAKKQQCENLRYSASRRVEQESGWCEKEALELAARALQLDTEYRREEGIVRDHMAFGWIYLNQGLLEESLSHFETARELAKTHGSGVEPLLAAAYKSAAYLIRNDLGRPGDALDYLKNALELAEYLDPDRLAVIRYDLGLRYLDLEDWEQALIALRECEAHWRGLPDDYIYRRESARERGDQIALVYNLTTVLAVSSERPDAWGPPLSQVSSDDIREVQQGLDTLESSDIQNDAMWHGLYLLTKGEALRLEGKLREARDLLQGLVNDETTKDDEEILILAHDALGRCSAALGDVTSAQEHAREVHAAFKESHCSLPYLRTRYDVMLIEFNRSGASVPMTSICDAS